MQTHQLNGNADATVHATRSVSFLPTVTYKTTIITSWSYPTPSFLSHQLDDTVILHCAVDEQLVQNVLLTCQVILVGD